MQDNNPSCAISMKSIKLTKKINLDKSNFLGKCKKTKLSTKKDGCIFHRNLLNKIIKVDGNYFKPDNTVNNFIIHFIDNSDHTYNKINKFKHQMKSDPQYVKYIFNV